MKNFKTVRFLMEIYIKYLAISLANEIIKITRVLDLTFGSFVPLAMF